MLVRSLYYLCQVNLLAAGFTGVKRPVILHLREQCRAVAFLAGITEKGTSTGFTDYRYGLPSF